MRSLAPALPWLLLLLGAADLIALKTGAVRHQPSVLAALFGAAGLAFTLRFVQVLRSVMRLEERRGRAIAETLLVLGILMVLAGGMANWLLGLQGFVILLEGETARLHAGAELQAFAAGPLARLEEMELQVLLKEVELIPGAGDRFHPLSRLRLWGDGTEARDLEVTPHRWAASRTLRFHQGAFGFAPRIVLLAGSEPVRTVADQVVPFITRRHGPSGIGFTGNLDLADEGLQVVGAVDLESLDEGLRGHATLHLTVDQAGRRLGQGSLLPGHFAELEDGYRIGFAGLEKWSEILISRRGYGRVLLVGAAVAFVAAILWPLAHWRRW